MEKGSSSSSSSSSSAVANGGPDSNCLKFGKKIYYEGAGSGLRPKTSGSPAKKGRAGPVQGGGHSPKCQVEGCKVDLSDAKAYYSRHKVCGMHSKTAKVIVAGLEQRFCQQCSRFHQLPEFDQGKRSCRRRLAGHNERRRKPPQGSLSSPRYGTLCPSLFDNNHSSKTGGFLMDFSAYSSLAGRDLFLNPTSEQGSTMNNQAAITGKSQLQLLSNNSPNPLSDLLTSRPSYSRPVVSPEDGSFNIGVSDSDNALSLLSNLPWAGPKSRLGTNTFLGQPPDNPPPDSAIGQFVCSPWGFKGNGDNGNLHEIHPDLGLGQAMNGQYNNRGLGLGQPSEGPQFHEMDQTRGYDSSSSDQHNMHWSL